MYLVALGREEKCVNFAPCAKLEFATAVVGVWVRLWLLARRLSLAGSTWHWIVSKFTIKNVQRKFLASRCGVSLCNDKNETCFAYICAMRLGAGACAPYSFIFHWALISRHVLASDDSLWQIDQIPCGRNGQVRNVPHVNAWHNSEMSQKW